MKSFLKEFKTFALRGNVVDLAVGVVIGAAFTAVSNSLVEDILSPFIGLFLGGVDFTHWGLVLAGEAVIGYGAFIQASINFVITAFALFLLVKFINKLTEVARKEQEAGTTPPSQKTPELQVLEEIRDSLRKST